MAVIPETVGIACPRCNVPIHCTLKAELPPANPGEKPGRTVDLTVPDLADRMADHYRDHHPSLLAEAELAQDIADA